MSVGKKYTYEVLVFIGDSPSLVAKPFKTTTQLAPESSLLVAHCLNSAAKRFKTVIGESLCIHRIEVIDGPGINDTVTLPRELTAENGAKAALSGEFYAYGREDWEGYRTTTLIPWDTIKQIYARIIEHFEQGERIPKRD